MSLMWHPNTHVGNECMHNIQSGKKINLNPEMEFINQQGKIKVSHNWDLSLYGNPWNPKRFPTMWNPNFSCVADSSAMHW